MVTIDALPIFESHSAVVPVYHYRRRPAKLTREPRALLYVATASLGLALGTMAGTAVGMWTINGVQASQSPTALAPAAAVGRQPVANLNPLPAPVVVHVGQSAVSQIAAGVKRAHHRWFWSASRHRWIRRHGVSYAQLHPVQTPKVNLPETAVVTPPPAVIAYNVPAAIGGPSIFYSEGDATVVDFDASAGKIETYEGRTFAIGSATQPGNTISWEDYRANVHYRCDQNGNCTLARKGVVVREAKLEL